MLGLALAGLLISGCGKADPKADAAAKPAGPAPVPVTLAPAQGMELQRSVRIVGSLVGLETATLSNRVSGAVSKIYVDRGDRVKPGQKLLEIEPDRYDMAVRESEASLDQTLARLGLKEVPGDDFNVDQTAPVKKAKSEYDNSKSKLDRATPLFESKVMKDFEYLDILSAFKSSESGLESSRDDARALLAQARQNRAQVQMRRKDAADSVIFAPGGETPDGLKIDSYAVTERKVSAGEYLREGTPAFTLVADNILKLQARVPERYLADVKKDAVVTFRVEAYPDEEFQGKVSTIDPGVDPASRTFLVEALVDNTHYGSRLRAGSFVPGEVLTKKEPNRVMVPLDAVTSFVGVTKVFKIDGASNPPKVKAVDVTTGQQTVVKDAAGRETQWVEISKGDLTAQDQVAVSGLTKLVDGSTVTVEAPAAKVPEASAKATP